MPNLLDSASNLHAALLPREFSARDLLGSTLAAIERLDPAVNAIVQKDAASAGRSASDSDTRIARGEARPLEGLPVTIKDCFEVAGMVTSAGAPALQNYTPKEDANAVARLRRAGAILLGKTNVPNRRLSDLQQHLRDDQQPLEPRLPPVGPRAEPRRPSPPGCAPSNSARISAARSAGRRIVAVLSA